jgi:hypothetical protein
MPSGEVSMMDERRKFVRLAMQEGANRRDLKDAAAKRDDAAIARSA